MCEIACDREILHVQPVTRARRDSTDRLPAGGANGVLIEASRRPPGRAPDQSGGWTVEIRQCDFGHKAEKLTWLYVVGCHPDDLPPMPPRGEPTGVIKPQRGVPRTLKIVTKAEREQTPPALAEWLLEVARRCEA